MVIKTYSGIRYREEGEKCGGVLDRRGWRVGVYITPNKEEGDGLKQREMVVEKGGGLVNKSGQYNGYCNEVYLIDIKI